ncbi:MAG: TonB-dependent receptor [Brachymonas sp.]
MKNIFLFLFGRGAVACLVLLLTTSIASATEGDNALPTVTVTANKIEQDVQDVPQSVTVIDTFELEERGIKSVADVIQQIPNMMASGGTTGHGTTVNMRGLNSSMFTNNNPVVIYIDGIPHSNRYGFDASLANVERIEVLRGPQGSIYGKDAIGGVINVITKRPNNNKWGGQVGAEYGADSMYRGTFNVSGAIKPDTLFWGINGQFSGDDGWIENTYPGMRKDASPRRDRKFSTYLRYQPHEQFDAQLTLNKENGASHWFDVAAVPSGTPLSAINRDMASHAQFDVEPVEQSKTDAQALALRWKLDNINIDAVTTHKKYRLDGVYDADFGINPYYAGLTQFGDSTTKTLTQEVRVSSANTTGLRWLAGLYLEKEKHDQGPYGMEFPSFDPATMSYLGNFRMNAESVTDASTQALFGQVIWPVAERLELTLGARWQRIKKEIDMDTYYLPVGMSGPPMYGLREKKTWSTFLPRAALSYQLNPQWTGYVSYAKGYMPGGYNYFASGGSGADNRFEPQVSNNYEVGIKGRLSDVTLAANLFYMDIKDIHIYKAAGAIYTTGNARKAHSKGAELEAAWRPAGANLEFSGALGIISAKYDNYDAGTHNFNGQKIENTPAHTLRLSAAYLHPSGAYARLDLRNQGKVHFYDDATKTLPGYGGYTVLDFKAGWRQDNWEVYGFVQNLTDREYLTGFMSGPATLAFYGKPRKFGVGARYSF